MPIAGKALKNMKDVEPKEGEEGDLPGAKIDVSSVCPQCFACNNMEDQGSHGRDAFAY